jgi:cell division protein FtsI (penicillin-binding protein 3)
VKGFYVGGKTGTAQKVINGHYSKHRLMTDFMAVMPSDDPHYLLLIMLDEPKPIPETKGFATSGWNAAPVTAKVITRIAPLLGLEPRPDLPPADHLILGAKGGR